MRCVVALVGLAVFLCIAVHAVTSPMPYRPGYGLGSWVPPEVIQGMKVEAYARSGILLADQMVNDATSLARELKIAQYPVKNPLSAQQEIKVPLEEQDYKKHMDTINGIRSKAWGMKISQYENLLNKMMDQATELATASNGDGKGTVKAFSTFASAVESPVMWDSSTVDHVDRAFDSITVSSAFMDIEAIKQITSSSESSSSSEVTDTEKFSHFFVSGQHSDTIKHESMQKLQQTYSVKSVETTLVLSSFATHRMVKQFTTLNVDPDKLREAWNYWKKGDAIPHPVYEREAFMKQFFELIASSSNKDLDNKISFVTEIFQGSALVGFVHFVKAETTRSSSETSKSMSSAKVELDISMWVGSVSGSTSFSNSAAKSIADMASNSGLDIQFDLVCLGYVPNIKSQVIETAIASFKDIDVNSQSSGRSGAAAQTEKQDNTNSVIGGTLGALNKMVSENPVLGVQTFMDAFDDFAQAAHSRPKEIGAPVGLNVKEYSKVDVMGALYEKYLGPRQENKKEDNASSPSS